MGCSKRWWSVLALAAILLAPWGAAAQEGRPLLLIHGRPDATSAPPEVRTHVSVIDKAQGRVVEGLTRADFRLTEAGAVIEAVSISEEETGMAVVIVVDRGGISRPNDPRIKQATDLARDLMERLTVSGTQASDDVIAVVGVGAGGVLAPKEDFSYNPVDTNLVRNALVMMEGEPVTGGTPLYEGLDEAINLLTRNSDATLREVLTHRRKIIVVFSDGVDPDFSEIAREQDIIRKSLDNGISIYAVGMAQAGGTLGAEANLRKLAVQTDGLYQLHNTPESRETVRALFDQIATQRRQYVLTHSTHQPRGTYLLDVFVETAGGSAEASREFASVLALPRLHLGELTPAGPEYTIPYSSTLRGGEGYTLTLRVNVEPTDGAARYPTQVRYFANGDHIGESTTAPDFPLEWNVGALNTAGDKPIAAAFTLLADAADPYLERSYNVESPVRIQVTWEALPFVEQSGVWLVANWWLLLILLVFGGGLLVLLLLLLRTRSEMAKKVVKGATGVLKGVTRSMGPGEFGRTAPAKLVIQRGTNAGREYPLAAPVVKVGRDPQFCDFAVYDDFVSNPHFSIHQEGAQFYITDEGSTNGTLLNGAPLPKRQRTPLPPNAVIELGQLRIQFKQLGGKTRPMDSTPMGRGQPAGPQQPNPYATRPVQGTAPPPPPASAPQNPYATRPVRDVAPPAAPPPVAPRPPDPYATRPVQEREPPPQKPPANPYATQRMDED